MNYWLICLPRTDMKHCLAIQTFGLARKILIGNVAEGDKVVCCAGKGDWKIIAVGEATSDYYVDDEAVFLAEGLFPDRFKFTARKLQKETEIIPLLDQLSFVTNLTYWAVYFRNGIAKISKEDWDLFLKASNLNS